MIKRKNWMSIFKDKAFIYFKQIVLQYKWMYAIAIAAQIILLGADLLFADTSRLLFNHLPHIAQNLLIRILITFAVISLIQMLFSFINNWVRSLLNESIVYMMRRKVLDHLQNLPLSFHENHHSSDSTNIVYRDLEFAKNFMVFDLQRLLILPLSFVFVGIYLFTVHPSLAVIAICIGPFQLLSNFILRKKFKEIIKLQNGVTRDVFFTMGETLQGIREIKSNQMENAIDDRMKDIYYKGVAYNVRLTNLNSIRNIAKDLPGKIGYILGIAIGASMMAEGIIGPGGLVAFIALIGKVAEPFTTMVDVISNLQQSTTGARKLYEVLNMPIEEKNNGMKLDVPINTISFCNVGFEYVKNRAVLKNLNFDICGGSTVALVGPSGGGKSTIVKLLFNFYAPSSGMIEINNVPVNKYSVQSLRNNMALVSQDIFMFDGTILDNIKAGDLTATVKDVENAAMLAQAHDFIKLLPEGYKTNVGERGIKLSQGQKQRISIARAILRKACILIMDEPTSALDVETEAAFQKEFGEWSVGCTKIIIAHRLSTIRNADHVIFIDSGMVIEQGPPQKLLHEGGRFRDYWDKQSLINNDVENAS